MAGDKDAKLSSDQLARQLVATLCKPLEKNAASLDDGLVCIPDFIGCLEKQLRGTIYMRFLFYIPSISRSTGGTSMAMEVIDLLNKSGVDAVALYDRPKFAYSRHITSIPRLWSRKVRTPKKRGYKRAVELAKGFFKAPKSGLIDAVPACSEWKMQVGDVLVVPEYASDWLPNNLSDNLPIIVFVQGYYPLMRALVRPGFNPDRFSGVLASSNACSIMSNIVFPSAPCEMSLYISESLYYFQNEKKFQVAYMPRKRALEAETLIKLIRSTPGLEDISFVPIDGLTTREAAQLLRDSLFFISLPEREGFGLPAAEAMATGALVVGYTGVGGDEFFNESTGFPVAEDNFMELYNRTVDVISRYRRDPAPLDVFRLNSSQQIRRLYSKDDFNRSVLNSFSKFSDDLAGFD